MNARDRQDAQDRADNGVDERRIGERVRVYPTAAGYADRSGQVATITRELDDSERDLAEVGRMFEVRFADGFQLQTFADELEAESLPPGLTVETYVAEDGALVVQIDTPTEGDEHETMRVYMNDALLSTKEA